MSSTTRVQAEALATLVRLIRPDWDHPGIVHAIGRCKREPLSEVAVALIRLAENGQAKTPALLPEPGRHWKRAALDDTPAGPNTRILADRDISIEAVLQKEPPPGARDVPIILLTYRVREQRMNEAIAAIEALDSIHAPVVRIRMEHLNSD